MEHYRIKFTTNQKIIVNEILIDPNNYSTMLAATSNGIYKTTDGGNSWSKNQQFYNYVDLDYKPGNSSIVYASTSELHGYIKYL